MPKRARQRPISATLSPISPHLAAARPRRRRPSLSVPAAPSPPSSSARAAASSSPPGDGTDWLSSGLLRVSYPLQALLLALGGAVMVAAPSRFCELALRSCPLPPPQTAIQLARAALALPAAASLALAHAASVPGRLSSATYVSLNAGLSLFGLAVAAAASAAVAPGSLPAAAAASSLLAPAGFYSSLLLIGPLALAVACSTAATVSFFDWCCCFSSFFFFKSKNSKNSFFQIKSK